MKKVAAASVLVLVAALGLSACASGPTEPVTITEAVHSQSQATPDFDSSEQTETDPGRLADLAELLAERGRSGDIRIVGNCEGGRTTRVLYTTAEGTGRIEVDTCGDDETAEAIDELIASWRS